MGIITDILKEIPLSAVLREKIIALETKMSILESENLVLKKELEKSKLIIEQQNKKIKAFEKLSHNNLLDDAKILILQCLSTLPRDTALPLEPIMSACNLSEQAALYHLQELEDESMIENDFINDVPCWFLDHDGRGYLIKHKLIS